MQLATRNKWSIVGVSRFNTRLCFCALSGVGVMKLASHSAESWTQVPAVERSHNLPFSVRKRPW
jgi:hypothetical protein